MCISALPCASSLFFRIKEGPLITKNNQIANPPQPLLSAIVHAGWQTLNSQMPELEHVSASPEGCTLGIHPTLSKLRPIISAHSPSSKGKTLEQLAPTLECFLQDQRRSPEHKEPSNPPQLLLSSIVYAGWQTLHSQMPRLEQVSVSPEGCTLGTLSSVSKLRLSISAHTPSSKGKTLEQLAPTLECFLQD